MEQSKLSIMTKEPKMNANLLNSSLLSGEGQYELAAISRLQSHDQRFITACIFILHKGNFDEIKLISTYIGWGMRKKSIQRPF